VIARPPVPGDLEVVLALLRAADASVAGDSDWTASDLTAEWERLDLERDAWVVELEGEVAGYASFEARGGRMLGDGYVHPERRGRGIGTELLRLTEERAQAETARAPVGERVYLQNATLDTDEATAGFYRARGYEPVRGFRGMQIDLEAEPEVPALEGVEIRLYRHPDEARAVHAAHQDAFSSHWEFRPQPWEEWRKRQEKDTFDPTLWWVAIAGNEIAGVSVCEHKRDPDQGWVDALGVRASYRRRGIAEALLRTAFAEFWRRGERRVGLGVDAESPTGATRLYERAGMRTLWHAVVWEKELRPA
jgi:mycothiol synthase